MTETLRADGRSDDARPTAMAIFIEGLIILLVIVPPLAMGAVAPWARAAVNVVIFAAFALWLLSALARGQLEFVRTRAWLLIALFLGIVALQIIPLPPGILAFLSPGAAETYAKVVPGDGEGARTLSLFPYGTRTVLIRLAALAMLFVLVAHFVRARWQVVGILIALLAVGLFETLYGFGEHFSGRNQVFWIQRTRHLYAVTGTYLNKNHFAGLLEMIVPAGLGLAFGLMPRYGGSGRLSARAANFLSSRRWAVTLLCLMIVLILCLGICFSVSRAGIACMVISFAAMAVFLGVSSGFRKYTLVLLILAMVVPIAATVIGAQIVAQRFEPIIVGKSSSWLDRLGLAKSGLSMIGSFPLFGTGAGSFEHAFERFQSLRVGDHVADYLHNDWLQLFCEYGFAGGGLFIAALVVFLVRSLRGVVGARDPFFRCTSVGALCGVGALLLHSFFDYNLSKITANSVIFTVLLGIAFAGPLTSSRKEETDSSEGSAPVRPVPLPIRIVVFPGIVAFVGLIAVGQVRNARADVACNRFLARNPEIDTNPYFFLPNQPSATETDAGVYLDRALELAPDHPQYHYYMALRRLRDAEESILRAARERAAFLIPCEFRGDNAEAVERLAEAMARTPRDFAGPEVIVSLNDAEDAVGVALRLQPVSARHNLLMAEIQARKLELTEAADATLAKEKSELYARRALWLGPTRPYVLQASSIILLRLAAADGGKDGLEEVWAETVGQLRRAIASDPRRADEIYPIVWALFGDPGELFAVTPRNLKAYSRLVRLFWEQREWEQVLVCLDEMDKMAAAREGGASVVRSASVSNVSENLTDENGGFGSLAYDRRDPIEIAADVSRHRCLTLGVLGRWKARGQEATRRQELLRLQAAGTFAEAQRQHDRRRYEDCLRLCRQMLQDDWSNPETLLLAANAAHALNLPSRSPRWESALDQLYRLVIYNAELSDDAQSEARALLARVSAGEDEERVVKRFVLALLDVQAGKAQKAEEGLLELSRDTGYAAVYWRQRHLIWHTLGRLAEARQAPDEAIQFYRKALDIVPTHRESLVRLAALGEDTSDELAALTPDVPCNVNFGGKVTLVGYSLRPVAVSEGDEEGAAPNRWTMTYVWEFHDRMFADYGAAVHFCDENARILFQNDHKLHSAKRPYPIDLCANGEVIVERHVQNAPEVTPVLLRVAMMTFSPQSDLPRCIPLDQGGIYLTAALKRSGANAR